MPGSSIAGERWAVYVHTAYTPYIVDAVQTAATFRGLFSLCSHAQISACGMNERSRMPLAGAVGYGRFVCPVGMQQGLTPTGSRSASGTMSA